MREKDVSDDVRKGLEDSKKCVYYMKENTVQNEVTLNEEQSMQNSISTEIEVAGQKSLKIFLVLVHKRERVKPLIKM